VSFPVPITPPSWLCTSQKELEEWQRKLENGICPTECDPDCEATCHDLHQVPAKRTHRPEHHGSPKG
jgi:hypothetical protein